MANPYVLLASGQKRDSGVPCVLPDVALGGKGMPGAYP